MPSCHLTPQIWNLVCTHESEQRRKMVIMFMSSNHLQHVVNHLVLVTVLHHPIQSSNYCLIILIKLDAQDMMDNGIGIEDRFRMAQGLDCMLTMPYNECIVMLLNLSGYIVGIFQPIIALD